MCLSQTNLCPLLLEGGRDTDPLATEPLLCDECGNIPSLASPEIVTGNGQPLLREIVEEIRAISRISTPATATGLLLYTRNLISMLFLGYLGQVEMAAGALSAGFANITGYSVIFGLAMGMEPICGQAYGAQKWKLLSLTLHRTVVILLLTSIPISLLWINVDHILLFLGQDPTITKMAKIYLFYALPDLTAQSFLHPIRIYLRSQNLTSPIAICTAIASLIHIPLNYFLVITLNTGIKGVAIAQVLTSFNLLILLIGYIYLSGVFRKTWTKISLECFREWRSFLSLAIPSCISICLEWWWYEFMIILCGLLKNPEETVSAIGILIQTTSLIYVFPSSLSSAVSTRVANEVGAGRPRRARWAAAIGTTWAAFIGLLAMAFTVWARLWWGLMFTNGTAVLELVAAALPIVGMCELGNCPQTTMCGVLRGTARANVGAHVNLGAFYAVGLPVALFLSFWLGFGFVGLWLGLLAAQASCAIVLGLVLKRTDWVLQVKRAGEITSLGKVPRGDEGSDEKDAEEESSEGLIDF